MGFQAQFLRNNFLPYGDESSAAYLGRGTSSSPATSSTAGINHMGFWFKSTATTGTARGMYLRHYLSGANGSGEALRAYATVEGAGATDVHGIHSSVSFGTSGTCTGETAALRATFQVPDKTLGGTNAPIYSEIWADGTSSTTSAGIGFIRAVLGGDATGAAALDLKAALFSIEGNTVGNAGDGKLVNAISGDKAVTHLARIYINGTAYWIMLRNAV